jgi:hypothetical protein
MLHLRVDSSKLARRAAKRVLLAGFLGWGAFACGDSGSGPSTPPPVPDAGGSQDATSDSGSSDTTPSDAVADGDAARDEGNDVPADRSNDTSSDVGADRSADAGGTDRSIDAVDADISADAPSEDAPVDQLIGRDSDAPALKATCTVDQPCVGGDCKGSSCDQSWFCLSHFAPHPCPFDLVPYCGCDGKTYYFPSTCPEVPYEHAGECGDGVNCDPNDVRCSQPEPNCGEGRVASVVGGCYGPCVPITSCRCAFAFECPHIEKYDCGPDQRCDVAMSY